jgi:putative sterol carrier protein
MGDADWMALQNGQLDRMAAFSSGRLQLAGDLELAVTLGNVFSTEAG